MGLVGDSLSVSNVLNTSFVSILKEIPGSGATTAAPAGAECGGLDAPLAADVHPADALFEPARQRGNQDPAGFLIKKHTLLEGEKISMGWWVC